MVEVKKTDYLSLVNQNGSGFNVSEIVSSIVAAEIEPKRLLQTTKLERTESAISGLSQLKSQSAITQENFATIINDSFFDGFSSDNSAIDLTITDETKAVPGKHEISNVQIAKNMVFQINGFESKTEKYSASLNLQFGSWSDPANIETGFIPSSSPAAQVEFTDKTIEQIADIFSDIEGISAQIVDVVGDGSSYTLIIKSDEPGIQNGFKIGSAGSLDAGDEKWITEPIGAGSDASDTNKITQLASNASFTWNGVEIERASNIVSDLIAGVNVKLNSTTTQNVYLEIERSSDKIRATAENIIFSMNEFLGELNRLTYIDVEGDKNGPLALDPSVAKIKSEFKKITIEPITGFGSEVFYLSQLGIKTSSSGEFYLDNKIFARALSETPDKFLGLKDQFLGATNPGTKVLKSEFTEIEAGTYEVSQIDGVWKAGNIILEKEEYDGGAKFSSIAYPGFLIFTTEVNPAPFQMFIGQSFAERVNKLMSNILDLNSGISKSEDRYAQQTSDIEQRLEKLKIREDLISSRYTQQFGALEQTMTQFNSTKTLLENFIEAWKKN